MTALGAAALFLIVLCLLDALLRPLYGSWDRGEQRSLLIREQVAARALLSADPDLARELEDQ